MNDNFQIQIVTGISLKIFDHKNLPLQFFIPKIGFFTKNLIIFYDCSKSFHKVNIRGYLLHVTKIT